MATSITFEIRPGVSCTMTVAETRTLMKNAMGALRDAPRVKCPTCRCHILAEEECFCCKYRTPDFDEDPVEVDCKTNYDTDQMNDGG